MSLQRLATFLTIAIMAAMLSLVEPAGAATNPTPQTITFSGGGWGHGVGMSQYGALGRAEAGFTAEEILAFYYQGTNLVGSANLTLDPLVAVDDVDVRVGVDNCSSFTPLGPGATGNPSPVSISVDDVVIATTSDAIAIARSYDTVQGAYAWQVLTGPGASCNGRQPVVSNLVADVCGSGCVGAFLTITFNDGEPIAIGAADTPGRRYAHGQIQLLPDGRRVPGNASAATLCGNPADDDFCVVVGNMTMQQYLYGLAEVPARWHFEALRSQAIAGRSYALATMSRRDTNPTWQEPFNLYASTLDQNYVGWDHESEPCPNADCRWIEAVDVTNDMYVATPDGQVATTFYSSSNGGYTNANEDNYQWAGWVRDPISYLRSNPDPYDNQASNPNAAWDRTYSLDDISKWLADYPYTDLDVGQVEGITIENTTSGYVDYALVTVYGSSRTLEIRRGDPSDADYDTAEPFGYRFWNALRIGCSATAGCDRFPGHRLRISSYFDVDPTAYFADAIRWMTLNDIGTGVSPNHYGPGLGNDRGTLALFMWNFAGRPLPATPTPFEDVPAGSEYETAVQWMVEKGITKGTTETTFSPDKIVSRDEAAVFLWRFAGKPQPVNLITFEDVPPNAWFETAMQWMVENEITLGTTATTYSPLMPLMRGDISTFLWRLAAKPAAFAPDAFLPTAMRAV